jgi:hypothetical protein
VSYGSASALAYPFWIGASRCDRKENMDINELNKAIDAFAKTGVKWADQGHKLAVATLEHLVKSHGDIGAVNRLYKAMPAGSKSSALVSWFLTYGALVANEDKDTKADKPFVFAKDKTTSVDKGRADPWYNHKPEPAPDQVFDVQKALAAILGKASRMEKKGGEVLHRELLAEIEAIASGEKKSPSTEPASAEAMQ